MDKKCFPVIVLSGPTAVGKSALSLELALRLNGEVVSADSMQVYKGMDIGTAKLSMQQRRGVPHHLIDVCDLQTAFNVVHYFRHCMNACQDIIDRGKVPIVVGGTGFYIRSFLYGPPKGPPASSTLRAALLLRLEKEGAECLWKEVCDRDPLYAKTITCRDKNKLIRGLEIMSLTKRRVSDFAVPTTPQKKFNFRCWFLYHPRSALYKHINTRCEEMVQAGLCEEVKELLQRGLQDNMSACQAIGYRQCIEYLSSSQTWQDWEQFIEQFKTASRRLAKRQCTWFRKQPLFQWIDKDCFSMEQIKEKVVEDYLRAI